MVARTLEVTLRARSLAAALMLALSTLPGWFAPASADAVDPAPLAGSFPRSILIPGTDVSLAIGGRVVLLVSYWVKGASPGGALNGQGGINQSGGGDGPGGSG